MAFLSPHDFQSFASEVSGRRRYVRSTEADLFLENLKEVASHRMEIVSANTPYFRSQEGHGGLAPPSSLEAVAGFLPHAEDRMVPIVGRAREGRANPAGIAMLYLATEAETAIMEVRPWIGSFVTVAQLNTRRELRLVDLSRSGKWDRFMLMGDGDPPRDKWPDIVWCDIDAAFSRPVSRDEEHGNYAVTQTIAEVFRSDGYDGIIYRSRFGKDGKNVALFSISDAAVVQRHLVMIEEMTCKWQLLQNWNSPEDDFGMDNDVEHAGAAIVIS